MEPLLQDLKYGVRALGRRPGYTAVAAVTLALGIGLTSAVFSVANGVLLRSLPYPDAHELVTMWEGARDAPDPSVGGLLSSPNFRDVRAEVEGLEGVALVTRTNLTWSGGERAEVVAGGAVSPDFFQVFGAEPILGRSFTADEARHQGPNAVVVSAGFWRSRLGGDPAVLGTTLTIDGESHPIVGIAPDGFGFPRDAQLWVPIQNDDEGCGRGCVLFAAVGRLADDAGLEGVRAELASLATRLEAEYPGTNTGTTFAVAPLRELIVGNVRTAVWVLMAAVGMVLLIACANVANLFLVRGGARTTELAVRSALGASRTRIVGQLMTENSLLAILGGAGGLLLALWGVPGLVALAPSSIPRLDEVALDGTTLVFSFAIVGLTVVVFGLAPAVRLARQSVAVSVGQGERGLGAPSGQRARSVLLVAEVALSVVLLLGAGLMVRSLVRMQSVDPGLVAEDVVTFRLSLPGARYEGPAERIRFVERLTTELEAVPGVERVAATAALPFSPVSLFGGFRRMDQPPPQPGEGPSAGYRVMDAALMDVLGLELVRGRGFAASDRRGGEPVVLINEAAAREYWPDRDPIGARIDVQIGVGYPEDEPRTVVGIVSDFRSDIAGEVEPEIYTPYAQTGPSFPHIAMQTAGVEPATVLATAREVLAGLDPELPMAQPTTLASLVERELAAPTFYLTLLALFAGMAVVLAAVGIYGVVAYLVVRRTREIGLRIALGAQVDRVLRMVVWQGLAPALVGLGFGLVGSLALGRLVTEILFQVAPTDPLTYGVVSVVLIVIVVAATAIPARRASRIPPAGALRAE